MKADRFLIQSLILILVLTGCSTMRTMKNIAQVTWSSDAGPIVPEQQWHEELVITAQGITFTRSGRSPETVINEGSWQLEVDPQQVQALFSQLETVDCRSIERVEPEISDDGGYTVSYTVRYGKGKTCSLTYDPGVTYSSGELVTGPVEAFIQELSYPEIAGSRYR